MKLTKIYTRTGDKGTTALVGGQRVKKDSPRLEAYGTMDELSSNLGMLSALLPVDDSHTSICDEIERIQCNIFNICTFLATDTNETPIYPSARLDGKEVDAMEHAIDSMNSELPSLTSFVLPGGCLAAAQCHIARTVCRRAERCIISLYAEAYPQKNENNGEAYEMAAVMLKYVNRLSDYLFVLSRKLNNINGTHEKTWKNTCR